MIPIEQLKKIPLFAQLSIEELARLAPLFHRHTYQVGEVVSQQGTEGDAFYVIESGRLRVRRVDAGGREHVLRYITAPGTFGETSLFTGVHRDATVDVFSKEAALLILPKREFDQFLNEHPDLLSSLDVHHEVKKKLDTQRIYKWLLPGEIVVINTRRHWYALILMLRIPILVLLALLVLAVIASLLSWGINLVLWGLVGVWLIGAGAWTVVDWSNDYYILTNRRVVHIEKVVFILDQREEAPIEQVANVQESVTGVAARTLGFGDVHVETSGRKSDIDFTFAPSALRIRSKIFEQMDRVRSRAAFEKRERMRAGIRQDLIERLDPAALRRAQARAAAAAAAKLSEPPGIVRKK
ncbi:partial Cyclic AMP receptor protein, partial [Anaerolineae bacterium]